MRIAIVGSRSITDPIQVKGAMIQMENRFPGEKDWHDVTEIVSGGADGVDTLAANEAKACNIKLTEFKPDYRKYPTATAACYARNQRIAEYCDAMIALWDGVSGGTIDVVRRARKLGKPVYMSTVWRNTWRTERTPS